MCARGVRDRATAQAGAREAEERVTALAAVVSRALGLAARAAHEATPREEARTCGVILARLIVEHRLTLHAPGEPEPAPAPDRSRSRRPIRIVTRYRTRCLECGARICIGEMVIWIRGEGSMHPDCYAEWRS